jgi:hypothetical protein
VSQKTKKKSGWKMAESVNSNNLDDVSSNKSSMVSVEDDREDDEDVDDGGNEPIVFCK